MDLKKKDGNSLIEVQQLEQNTMNEFETWERENIQKKDVSNINIFVWNILNSISGMIYK
jgi:hypothetical protein